MPKGCTKNPSALMQNLLNSIPKECNVDLQMHLETRWVLGAGSGNENRAALLTAFIRRKFHQQLLPDSKV